MAEKDGTETDEAASLNFREKRALFESKNKSSQAVTKRDTQKPKEIPKVTGTTTRQATVSKHTISRSEFPNTPYKETDTSSPSEEKRSESPHMPYKQTDTSSSSEEKRSDSPHMPNEERDTPSTSEEKRTEQHPGSGIPKTDTRTSQESIRRKFESELQAKLEEISCRQNTGWSHHEMDVFKRPMCLISTGTKNVLSIEEDVLGQISRIDWPLVIISVVGLYRTGKSYLMNRLAQANEGFALGNTIESKTKGIWVWCRIHPEKPNTVLVLLDTEGLGDVKKGDPNHDNRIFTLAVLLCNTLVYNMKGAFDQDAVNKLTFVTKMSSNIRFADRCDEKNKALKAILPEFVLCLRDFSLRLYVEGKGKLTEDDYLKDCLQHQKEMDESYNKPRECIRDFFSSRKCFTMPVPGDDEILENLETLEFDQLSKRFQEATVRFVSYIYSKDPKELIVSKPVNGKMFEVLTTQYVEALKHGAVPDVDDAFTAVAKIENARVAAEALEIFESQIKSVKLPIPTATLRDLYKNAQQQALDFLNPKVVHDGKNTCKNEAKMKMDNIWEEKKEENTKKLHDLCEITIKQKNEAILEPNIKNNAYNKAGGFRHYKRDIERMREEYVHALNDFDEHEVLGSWLEFVQQKRDIENIIIGTDDALTEKQKQEEKQQNKQMIEKLTKEQDEKYKAELQKQKKELEDQHKKIQADQKAQNDKDNERLEKLLNRINYLEEEDKKRKVKLENLEEEDKKRKEKLENLEEEDKERKEKIHRLEEEDRKRKAKGFIGRMWSAIAGE